MFDPNTYREACARLTPGAEKLEEMIAMTENTNRKKHFSRPIKTVLIAAACVAALCVTAMAAPAVQKLFMSFSVTFTDQNGNIQDAQMFICPDLALEKRDGKDILTVDGKEIDVTDAFAKDGKYVLEEDGATVTVTPDGQVEVCTEVNGDPIVYTFRLTGNDAFGVGSFSVDDEELTGGEIGSYIVTDQNGAMEVTPAE